MGTRGAVGFIKDGEIKVAYNHFDSYPEGLGEEVLNFVREYSVDQMREMFDKIELVDEDSTPTKEQIQRCREVGTINLGVGSGSEQDWYCLLRGCQGNLKAYADTGLMVNAKKFLGDSLFCEYAYLINLDDETLETYKGFQQSQPKGRFSDWEPDKGYYAVGLTSIHLLKDLPIAAISLIPEE